MDVYCVLKITCIFLILMTLSNQQCVDNVEFLYRGDVSHYTNCKIVDDDIINCGIYGYAHPVNDQVPLMILVWLNLTLQIIHEPILTSCNDSNQENNYDGGEWWALAIKEETIDSFWNPPNRSKSLWDDPSFSYPEKYSSFSFPKFYLTAIYGPTKEIDGLVYLPSSCDPQRLKTSECINNFHGVSLKTPIPSEKTENIITLQNFLFFSRSPKIKTLFYVSAEISPKLKFLTPYLTEVENIALKCTCINVVTTEFTELLNSTFPYLKHFQFIFNNLYEFANGFFSRMVNLESLSIPVNFLKEVPHGLGVLKGLKKLDLNSQYGPFYFEEFTLQPDELNLLTSLEELNLEFLNINEVSRQTLPSLSKLRILYLGGCTISSLPEDTFINFSSLEELYLDFNQITFIEPQTFKHLQKIIVLGLSANEFEDPVLLNLFSVNFTYVDLSHNRIKDITTVISNGNISHLNLGSNFIQSWPSNFKFITNNYNIYSINISLNNISAIDSKMGNSLNELINVDIGGNPYDCQSCLLNQFQIWLKSNSTLVYNLGKKSELICETPYNQKERGDTILSAKYNMDLCKLTNYYLSVGVPVIVLFSLVLIFGLTLYVHRYELVYIRYMWNLKRRSENESHVVDCEFDVFVSYSHQDRPWVREVLVPNLEEPPEAAPRYHLCLHERDFAAGGYVMDNIASGIERSRKVLLVVSPSFVQSQWCQWELRLAQHRIFEEAGYRSSLILLELERLSRNALPINLRLLMGSRTYLEWPATPADERAIAGFWERLRTALGTPLELPEEKHSVSDGSEIEKDEIEFSEDYV